MTDSTPSTPTPSEALADLEAVRRILTDAALGKPITNRYSAIVSARRVLSAVEAIRREA